MQKDLNWDRTSLDIPAFLKRKGPKKKKSINNEYIAPKEREIVTRFGQPKTIVIKDKELPKVWRPSIQEAIREKNSNIIGEIEGMIDDGLPEDFSMFKYLNKIGATGIAAKAIAEKYAPIALELNDVLTLTDDEQLQEGYAHLSWDEVEVLFNLYSSIIEDCSQYTSVKKLVVKAKKKKPVKKEKLLKNFKYLEKDDNYKIASVNPEKIIEAIELWAFNIKTRQLTVYRALDRGGLSVKGASIVNFDENNSMTKTVRKPEETIQKVLTGGKIILRKIMDELTPKPVKPIRINKQTIILKVI